MHKIKIYHNPRCSKSRKTLQIIKDNNYCPEIKLYLEEAITVEELKGILEKLNLEPRDIIRTGEEAYRINSLDDLKYSNNDLLNFMVDFPKLIERPIIIMNNKAVLGRPPENVYKLFY
jgi:arsenate reductase